MFDQQRFQVSRLSDYSDAALLDELKRVASAVPDGPLTKSIFESHSRASASTLTKRFGGWENALAAANLAFRYGGQSISDRMRRQPGKSVTREDVVAALCEVAKAIGRQDLTVDDFTTHGQFSVATVRKFFPQWHKALQAAGLTARPSSVRYTDEECFENLLRVWTQLGREPKYREMNQPPSQVGGKAYVGRWKTWTKALEAFVTRTQSDDSPAVASETSAGQPAAATQMPKANVDDGRVKLGLRYRVLVRDRFKCEICGNSPASDPKCKLHVDHIQPSSKGGLTVLENLRTLCEACNLGKGDLEIE
jgi:hypothetical protein